MSQQRVREALQAAEGYLSGEELSRGIGITRAAVWKAVENLRRQGYDIEARTGKGYRLRQSPDLLRRETVEPYLTARRENWQVLETVDSTNSLCRRLALEGAPDGTAVLADCQTAGRGRRGRSFQSAAGKGLFFSVLWRPHCPPEKLLPLTALSAVATCRAIRRVCGAEAQIGLSKEYASVADGHAAYLEAMEALQATHSGEVQAAGGWDDMAVLCARTLKILEKEYMDETLTLQSVSERLHVSPNYLGANLKKHAGDTFMNLLIKKRMDVARNLLQNGTSRIAEVARRCGYSDQSYFGYCFKKYYGLSPARMRQMAAEYGETAQ